jgi:hypothetical protein
MRLRKKPPTLSVSSKILTSKPGTSKLTRRSPATLALEEAIATQRVVAMQAEAVTAGNTKSACGRVHNDALIDRSGAPAGRAGSRNQFGAASQFSSGRRCSPIDQRLIRGGQLPLFPSSFESRKLARVCHSRSDVGPRHSSQAATRRCAEDRENGGPRFPRGVRSNTSAAALKF